ncbi:MAG: S-layer homology domain-containing protein, partial [Clostridiales bacterium]|nr:S-layer homology domain-containing protein [Clostridiales bacterium]
PGLADWVLVSSLSQTVIADSGAAVDFSYRTLATNEVQVKAVEEGTGIVLQSYVLSGTVGEPLTVKAPAILGWLLTGADTAEPLIGTDREVIFEYEKNVATITVHKFHLASSTEIEAPATVEVAKGGDITIYAPHIEGYVITDLGSSITMSKVVTDVEVSFFYQTIAEVAPEHLVTVTVIGQSGTTKLYSYEMLYPKNSGTVNIPAFELSAYLLTDPTPQPVDILEVNKSVFFNYESLATTVKIRMLDEEDHNVAPAFDVGAEVGSAFTYNAPDVAGYYLLPDKSSIGTVEPVVADGVSEIIFRYARITSKLTVVARENDTFGRVIRIVEIADPIEGPHDYDAPDLSEDFYTPLAHPNIVSIDWDGINTMFGEAYYSKDLVDIEINKEHFITSDPIGSPDYLRDQRKGEAVRVGAPDVADMALVGNTTLTVIADDLSSATFRYRDIADDEVVIKAIDKPNNLTLLNYSMSGTVGDTFFVNAPVLLGWLLADDERKSAALGTNKELRFEYLKNVVEVTVNILHISGYPLMPATVVEVPRGGNYTAYAPHITGYMIEGKSKEIFANIISNVEVTFEYKIPLEDFATVTMHYLNTATNALIMSTDPIEEVFFVGQHFDSVKVAPVTFDANDRRWELDTTKTTRITLAAGNNEANAYYTDKGPVGGGGGGSKTPASLIVRAKDVKTGDYIYEQILPVYIGDRHTINAPVIESYTLDASSSPSQTITITLKEHVVIFNYNYTGDKSGAPFVSDNIRDILEVDNHVPYLSGYPDKTVRPDIGITRAEVAMIFWRLVKSPAKNDALNGSFSDLKNDVWYTQAINYLAKINILKGYPDGAFKPSQIITRAELTAIVSRFDDLVSGTENPFSDLKTSHWAHDYIMSAYYKGWVNGYPSGIFLPDQQITRAEAVTVINRMLGRILDKSNVPGILN